MIPGSLAMLSTRFAAAERGKAIGTWSAFSVLASAIGPVLGGLLARGGHWRWVFFINLPLAAIVLAVLWLKTPPDPRASERRSLDWRGALAAVTGLTCLNFGLIQWPREGLLKMEVWAALCAGIAALALFVVTERRTTNPLVPFGIFKSRALQGASWLSLLFYMAFHGILFFLPLNLIQAQGYDPAVAGMTQLPLMALLVLLSRRAGKLVDGYGPRLPLTLGPMIAGIGFLLLVVPEMTGGPREFWRQYLPGLLLVGAGLGLTAAPLSATVMTSIPDDQLGLASGINSSLSRLAGVLAIAVMGAVMLASFEAFLQGRVASLGLSDEVMAQLKREAPKLAETPVPAGLNATTSAAVKGAIQAAFVDGFRTLASLAAGLSWLGAFMAFRLLPGRRRGSDSKSEPIP